jgi:RNA polymerase sigma factor (sigma-70 family)
MAHSASLPNFDAGSGLSISQTFEQERRRLFAFIRDRVSDLEDAEDILQDVFFQLVNHYDSIESLDRVSSWLFTVARNKITDSYRKKRPERLSQLKRDDSDAPLNLGEIMPDLSGQPDELYARGLVLDALEAALDELPAEQRDVFTAHEFEGVSFKQMAEDTGLSINTLLSRKRYAVLHLREHLKEVYEEL